MMAKGSGGRTPRWNHEKSRSESAIPTPNLAITIDVSLSKRHGQPSLLLDLSAARCSGGIDFSNRQKIYTPPFY